MKPTIEQLQAALGMDAVLIHDAVAARPTSWIDATPLQARAIVRPRSTAEVATALRLCHEVGQAVVTQGGRTNLVGATSSSADDVVLSLERMTDIESIDRANHTMLVQAGAPLQAVQEAADAAGLLFPLDLAARGSATIGGCAAMNAGGVRVIRYGVMRDLVLGVEAVLADGAVITSLNQMLKNNAGYDLKQLFIGSEGTLGVITRLVLRLYPKPSSSSTTLLAMESFDQVMQLLALARERLSGELTSFEVMWNDYYRLTTTPPALSTPPLPQHFAYYVLMEALGASPDEDRRRFEQMLEQAESAGCFAAAVLAQSTEQRARLWRIREDSEQIERQHPLAFGFDVSLPIGAMAAYTDGVRTALNAAFGSASCWTYGHVGDGNLHLNVAFPGMNEMHRTTVAEIVYRPLAACGGSISAEHGIGLEKKVYLGWCRSAAEIALMRRVKAALDPQGILNRGKVFDE